MKKIFIVLVVLLLVIIAFFQYKNYSRYNPPSYFNYAVNDSVDINYYDPIVVQQYFENSYEIGSFARQLWFKEGIDINFLDETNEKSRNAVKYYKTLYATTSILEKRLIESKELKEKGLNNNDIRTITEQGVSLEIFFHNKAVENIKHLEHLELGESGQGVWSLQELLIENGYEMPLDGNFGVSTFNAVKKFQEKKGLYPSGIADITTIKELVR